MRIARDRKSRREVIARGIALLSGWGLLGLIDAKTPALAAKAAKSDFLYQNKPKDDKSCAGCQHFIQDSPNEDNGTCAVVDGVVSRRGWCLAYTPKK